MLNSMVVLLLFEMYKIYQFWWLARQRSTTPSIIYLPNFTQQYLPQLLFSELQSVRVADKVYAHAHTQTQKVHLHRGLYEKKWTQALALRSHSWLCCEARFSNRWDKHRKRCMVKKWKYDINTIKQKIYMWYRFRTVTMIHLALTTAE